MNNVIPAITCFLAVLLKENIFPKNNNHRESHEVLMVKNGKEQCFNYRQPKFLKRKKEIQRLFVDTYAGIIPSIFSCYRF